MRPTTPADMLEVPGGPYVAGSTPEERETAYLDAARTSGSDGAGRGRWFEREEARHPATLPAFRLDRTHVTNARYAEFVRATGRRGPTIDEAGWRRQGYRQSYAREVSRSLWHGQTPPAGREDHPVVLITQGEAAAYCAWRGARLPTAAELEKAMRGPEGRIYPWGNEWDRSRLNTADGKVLQDRASAPPGAVAADTEPVGSYPAGAGPYGHLDLAGEAFHWTSTVSPYDAAENLVKGSGWDDSAGVGRGAASHGRPRQNRHVLVGFRCAAP